MINLRLTIAFCLFACSTATHAVAANSDKPEMRACSQSPKHVSKAVAGTLNRSGNLPLVSFGLDFGGPFWCVDIQDPRISGASVTKNRVGPLIGLCSQAKFLSILNAKLADFHRRRPYAKIDDINLEMTVSQPLWNIVSHGLREVELTMPGAMVSVHNPANDDLLSPPSRPSLAITRVLHQSATIAPITSILSKHGLIVTDCSPGLFYFRDSLIGKKWSAISKLPDGGIDFGLTPIIDFEVTQVRPSDASRKIKV